MTKLESEFNQAMMDVYRTAKEECGYNATRFLDMLHDHGGIETAHRLLGSTEPQFGFTKLWERGRLDITVECLVLNPRFQVLFEDHELGNGTPETSSVRLRSRNVANGITVGQAKIDACSE